MKRWLLRINHSDTQDLSHLWYACIRISHKNSVLPFRQKVVSFQAAICLVKHMIKVLVLTLNYKFLKTLIHTEQTRELIINAYIVVHRCSVFFYRQQGVYKIVWSVFFTFVATLLVYSIKMVLENYWCSSSIACQEKKTG